jgi:hypothetical protein
MKRRTVVGAALAVAAAQLASWARSEALPLDERERSCWLAHTAERTRVRLTEPTAVDFANLRDGYRVRSPFRIDFAVRGMGVIPAGKPNPKAGHHHLLIDTPLPYNVAVEIPFNAGHRHYGKAQTGTVIDLAPGPHTLRLLFADHLHRPYFVYSPEISVQVSGPRTATPVAIEAGCAAWYQEELSRPRPAGQRALVSNLRDGEPVVSPFNVRLAVDGYGVSPRGTGVEGTGHFLLSLLSDGKPVEAYDLSNGATQVNVFAPPARYTLQLRFQDDHGRDLVPSSETGVTVTAQQRR